jgi:hypothetical protein
MVITRPPIRTVFGFGHRFSSFIGRVKRGLYEQGAANRRFYCFIQALRPDLRDYARPGGDVEENVNSWICRKCLGAMAL